MERWRQASQDANKKPVLTLKEQKELERLRAQDQKEIKRLKQELRRKEKALAHVYFGLEDETIWQIVSGSVPALAAQLNAVALAEGLPMNERSTEG